MRWHFVKLLNVLAVTASMAWGVVWDSAPAQDQPFIRGDANQDGVVSISDMVFINRWWMNLYGSNGPKPACLAAADLSDNKRLSICDIVGISNMLFYGPTWSFIPPAPFPEPGPDTDMEHAANMNWCGGGETSGTSPLGCESYVIQPAEETDDLITIGSVVGSPGEEVRIPVYLTTGIPVTAVQLIVKYDPSILQLDVCDRRTCNALSWEGTFYEQFFGKWFTYDEEGGGGWSSFLYDETAVFCALNPKPEQGLFTAVIGGSMIWHGFEVTPGQDTLVAWIHGTIAPDAPADTVISLEPTNGPDGQGTGPFRMRNEITFDGNARYLSYIPKTEPGILRVAIVGDVTFFIRGDANRDRALNVSDAIFILGYLFLGTDDPPCADAADADDNGAIELTDAIAVLDHLFLGTVPLPQPYPTAGTDPTIDSVGGCRE